MSEHYVTREDFAQITEAMSAIQETALRVDERVKVLLERQGKSDAAIHDIQNNLNNLVNRVTVLESKDATEIKNTVERNRDRIFEIEKQISMLTMRENNHESRWKVIFDLGGKVLWIIIAAYLLYKLGLNPPSIS